MQRLSFRLLILILAAAALAGCANGANNTALTQTAAAKPASLPPVFFLVDANNMTIPGTAGSWCWKEKCVDQAKPNIQNFLAIEGDTIRVRAQSPVPNKFTMTLTPTGDSDPVLSAEIVPDGSTVEWESGAPAGEYVLEAHGEWSGGGDISYFFGVRVGE